MPNNFNVGDRVLVRDHHGHPIGTDVVAKLNARTGNVYLKNAPGRQFRQTGSQTGDVYRGMFIEPANEDNLSELSTARLKQKVERSALRVQQRADALKDRAKMEAFLRVVDDLLAELDAD